ncbi:MFS transporter [Caldivirga maquilingensis]|uniref:Major facilitator superfamily MFS_1 n=1 Tax=Caldivirga maquilingensis (strain ATCC 700844 / DSM 13496 / JCM 10307 / IC-167) TaxID=397948 RepID=A8MA66_CALMQ|nr:MFS transporter [Caldivirga maquilingensis]ABW00998.1 major facilitator superfamily MFS_1 [Caldivirga maquilingensis IC-167]
MQAIIILLVFTFMARASNNMIQTTVPLIAREYFNSTEAEVGLLSSIISVSLFIATMWVNARLDSAKRRILFEASTLLYFLTFLIYPFVNYIGLWLTSIAVGFLLGIIMPNVATASSIIGRDQETRERVIALYTFALSLSLTIGPVIESIILRYFTLRDVFLFFSVFSAIMILLSPKLPFPAEKPGRVKFKLSSIWGRASFRVAIYNNAMYSLPFAMLTAFGGIYAIEYFHANNSLVYLLFSAFFTTSFATRLYISVRPIRDVKYASLSMSMLTIVGLVIMTISPNIYLYAISLAILGVPHGLTYPLSLIVISRDSKDDERNLMNSAFSSIMTIIGILSPIALGVSAELMGLRYMTIIVEASVVAFTWLLYRSLRELNPKASLVKNTPNLIR